MNPKIPHAQSSHVYFLRTNWTVHPSQSHVFNGNIRTTRVTVTVFCRAGIPGSSGNAPGAGGIGIHLVQVAEAILGKAKVEAVMEAAVILRYSGLRTPLFLQEMESATSSNSP